MTAIPPSPPLYDLKGKSVLLINPEWKVQEDNIWKSVASCYPSIGLAMIAAYLEHCGACVQILDLQAVPDPDPFAGLSRPDWIGISSTTVLADSAYHTCEAARTQWPGIPVIFGGVHPTILPHEVLEKFPDCYLLRGESEHSMAALVAGEPPETVKGTALLRDGQYWEHPECDLIENLNDLPMPAYHLLPMKHYRPPLGGALRQPCMSIFSTRGCPGNCTFCNSALSKKLRFLSADRVIKEIQLLTKQYGIREVSFYDDSFCADRQRVRKICKNLIEQNIRITWSCMSRVNFADEETLAWMKRAGCHMICYGVESSSPDILRTIRKGINLNKVRSAVEMTKKSGIRTRLSFMYGNPGETRETMQQTLDFALSVDPDLVQFNITTPYPGTEMYEQAEQQGLMLTHDWRKYDLYNVVMKVPGLEPQEILDFYHTSYRRFFMRPGYLFKQAFFFMTHPLMLFHSIAKLIPFLFKLQKNQ